MDPLQLARVIVRDPPTSYDSAGLFPLSMEVIALHEQNAALRERVALLERVREDALAFLAACNLATPSEGQCVEGVFTSEARLVVPIARIANLRAALDAAKKEQP